MNRPPNFEPEFPEISPYREVPDDIDPPEDKIQVKDPPIESEEPLRVTKGLKSPLNPPSRVKDI